MTIKKQQLEILYEWAKNTNFPFKKAPTSSGYANKEIYHCWVKSVIGKPLFNKKIVDEKIFNIIRNPDILFITMASFPEGIELGPHKDPNIYKKPYKRIQIPIKIPDKEKCFMIWDGDKVFWEEGIPQVFFVMDHIHEGYNHSKDSMDFLFVDVEKQTKVELF